MSCNWPTWFFRRPFLSHAWAAALAACAIAGVSLGADAWAQSAPAAIQAAAPSVPGRPRIGLVLSGGGARGIAHVGVLKVLERERIPVDLIAGTSMGAIVGGLYASGMTADQIEQELRKLEWSGVFAPRVSRQELSQRLKEDDFEFSSVLEFGIRDGQLTAPQSTVSSRGLEVLMRRFTLPVRDVDDFDRLPIPFRAVATNMENGQAVVIGRGDLALALRSSMSVPGVFAPIEVEGSVLGDGGLVDNLPVDVARRMGADVVIAVNIGTPLAGRDTLNSLVGLTAQMINILTEQNVQRSLKALRDTDVLITPDLGNLSSADFDRTPDLLAGGERGAQVQVGRLASLTLSPADWSAWRQAHAAPAVRPARLAVVRLEGSDRVNPQRLQAQLESQPGQPFDPAAAERDVRRLAATGNFMRTDYTLRRYPDGDGLIFELEEKSWGPNYVRVGLDVATDFDGNGAFNIKFSHKRLWLTPNGTEWRNQIQIGEVPKIATEIYHPLNWTIGLSNDWFVSAYAGAELRQQTLYAADAGDELARFNRTTATVGLDLGQPWGGLGEVRLGPSHTLWRLSPRLLGADYLGPTESVVVHETGLRLRTVVDQLDFANFPQKGYRFTGEALLGVRGDGAGASRAEDERFRRLETDATVVWTRSRNTLNLYGALLAADPQRDLGVGRYALGGFHQLSGYEAGQVRGNAVLFGRLTWYRRLSENVLFNRGFFLGATVEAGQAWNRLTDLQLGGLRTGGSVFLGADTGLGPLYFGLTYAPQGSAGVALFIGRP